MKMETAKIETGVYKVTVSTSCGHYMFEKVVLAMDIIEAEAKVKRFCAEWHKNMRLTSEKN